MVLVNYSTRELTAKLVYYGPGLCGKTTNLQYIYENLLPKDRRGKMVSLATETDRTLFFDFLPLELGTIRGLKTRLQLYTVPGQVHYNATRKIVLKGADGIVFVADSQASARESNIEAFRNMKANLAEHGLDLRSIPHVLQFNKRDLPGCMGIEQMVEDLNEYNSPFFEATAVEGIGVEDALKGISKLVLKNLAGRFQAGPDGAAMAVPAPSVVAAPAPPIAAARAPPPVVAPPAVAAAWTPPPPVVTAAPPVVTAAPPVVTAAPPVVTAAPPVVTAPPPVVTAPPPVVTAAPTTGPAPEWPWPAPVAARPAAVAPTPAFAMPSVDLEDLLINVPGPSPAAVASDVFGLGPTIEQAAQGSGDLEDMLLAAPPVASAPQPRPATPPEPTWAPEPILEFDSADSDMPLSGDAVLSEEPALTQAEPPVASLARPVAPDPVEAELLSGDTIMSESPSASDFEFDSGLLSGDTMVMSATESSPAPTRGLEMELSIDEEIPLSMEDEIPLSMDEEVGAAPDVNSQPMALDAGVFEAAALAPAVIDIPVALHLGSATPGEMVERVLRVPVEYDDASGTRRLTLEVTLRFRLS